MVGVLDVEYLACKSPERIVNVVLEDISQKNRDRHMQEIINNDSGGNISK